MGKRSREHKARVESGIEVPFRQETRPRTTRKEPSGSTAIHIENSSRVNINNVRIMNFGTGIYTENSEVYGNNLKLQGNKRGLVTRHSKVDIDGLVID